tara:strand:+ start:10794 stop:11000 length:207 start_codon:yes stop_codon:yes gene_type:complete
MKNNDFWKLTSIKVLVELYQKFRVDSKIDHVTLQKLVNRSMYLYLNDPSFRDTIRGVNELSENYKKGY